MSTVLSQIIQQIRITPMFGQSDIHVLRGGSELHKIPQKSNMHYDSETEISNLNDIYI